MSQDRNQHSDAQRSVYQLQRRVETLGAQRDPQIGRFLALLQYDSANETLVQSIDLMLDDYEEEQRLAPNLLAAAPSHEELYGPYDLPDFEIGWTTETGVRFGLRIASDCGSVAVTGISGGGKTTLVQNIIVGVHQRLRDVAVVVFDVKGDYTCLASLPHPDIHVHNVREDVPMRLFQPPAGVPLEAWLATVATYFCEYRGLKKSRHLFLDTILRLCKHFGVDQDPCRPWPSMHNALDYLSQMHGSKSGKGAEYKASLMNELQGLLEDTGSTFDASDGIDLEQHLLVPGGIVVLQVDTLPAPAQQMIISLSVERIIAERVARNVHNSSLEVLVVLDEAQLVLSRRADFESANGVAPLATQLLRAREAGVSFIAVPHLLPDISRSVLASAKTMFVVGGLSDVASIDIAAKMMNLPPRAKTMIPRLGRGQALVREMGKGAFTDAYLVDLDDPVLVKDAIDEPTRKQLMAPKLAGMPRTSSKPLTDYPTIMAELNTPWAAPKSTGPGASSTQPLSQEQADLLLDGARHRDDWMKERRARLKIRDYKILQRLAQSLEAQGLAILRNIRLGRTTYTVIEVSDSGWQTLGKAKPPHYIGHGGLLHTILISRVAQYLTSKRWSNVQPEYKVGQWLHPVDVYGRSPKGVPTAFEITLSNSNVVSNALQTLAPPSVIQELIFLCPIKDECKRVERLLRADPGLPPYLKQIQIRRIDEFIS